MSLLGGIEVTNFLNEKKAMIGWHPRYRGERFSFGGFSSVVQIPNGRGKTSILSSVLGILSLDKTLRAEMKSRMAPEKVGIWSHVRVEFIDVNIHLGTQMHVALGEDLPGRRTTFGACGNSNGDVIYYYFPREFDAAPTFNVLPDGSRELLTNDEFRDAVKAIPGSHWDVRPFADKIRWLSLVHHHMPKNSLARNVSHLKRGAGDKSTELFKVSTGRDTRGAPFDTRFFWQHIAPELLAGPRIQSITKRNGDEEFEQDGQYFEDSISRSGRELLAASRHVERQEQRIKKVEKALDKIRPLEKAAIEAVRAEREQIEAVKALSHVVGLFDDLITKRPLPGLLRTPEEVGLDGLAADILPHIVWVPGLYGARDGQPALWSRYVMGDLAGLGDEEQPLVLRRALGESYGLEAREVIENTCNIRSANTPKTYGGKPPRWLTEADIIRLIEETNRWRRPKQAIKEAVREAFATIEKLDTNPFRALGRMRRKEIDDAVSKQRELEAKLGTESRELDKLNVQKEKLTENESHYRSMQDRGFSSEECEEPGKAGARLREAIETADKTIHKIIKRRGELEALYDAYTTRQTSADDNWTPEAEANVLQIALDMAEAGFTEAVDTLDASQAHLAERESAHRTCETRRQKAELHLVELQAKASFQKRYVDLFGDREPEANMENDLRDALSTAETNLRATQDIIKILSDLNERAAHFFEEEGGQTAQEWLQWVDRERDRLAVAIAQGDQEIDEAKARLERLKTAAVAPAGDVLRAVDMIPADKTWRTVSDVITDALKIDEDRRRMGSFFNPLLSAPVFDSEADARGVRAILDEKDIQVPVFLTVGLTNFLKDGGERITWDGTVAAGMMLGCRNDIVESMVDPKALERQKDQLRERLSTLSDLHKTNKADAHRLRSEGPLVRAAEAARNFADKGGEEALLAAFSVAPDLTELVENAKFKTSPEAFEAIRNWRDFLATGGQEELAKRDHEYRDARTMEKMVGEEVATLRKKLPSLVSARKAAEVGASEARRNAMEIPALRTLQQRLDNGDFEWFARSATHLDAIEAERRQLEDRQHGIDFGKAQQFVDSRDNADDPTERIERLRVSTQSLRESIDALGRKRTALTGAVSGLVNLEVALDNLAALTIYRYRKVQDFIEASRQMTEISPQLDEEDSLYGTIENLRDLLNDPNIYLESASRTSFISQASTVMDYMKGRDSEEERAKTAFNKARNTLDAYQRRRDELLRDESGEELMAPIFEQFRRCSPTAVGPQIRLLEVDLKEKEDQRDREANDLAETRKAYMQTWQYLIEDGVKSHLSYLESILKATPDTTFELDVTIVDAKEWERILVDVLDKIEGIEQKAEEDLSKKKGAAQEELHRADIRAQIADVLYPRLFPEARIYVRHKAIGGDGRFPFDSGVSQGEFASLELLWTVKLAEFAFKRDAIECGSALSLTQAQRRQAEKSAQGVLIIDGLFSNLSDDDLIDLSLGNCGKLQSNFQIIGFLHPPHYRNNFDIFPRMLIGKSAIGHDGDGRHVWTEIVTQNRDGTIRKTEPGEMVVTTVHGRRKPAKRPLSKTAEGGDLFIMKDGDGTDGKHEHGPS
ncbi:MAG: hypothetical protein Q7R40_10890 [Phaeospirillum sp.]|nr:hypothetical protein [Phaeospirillum sp.]